MFSSRISTPAFQEKQFKLRELVIELVYSSWSGFPAVVGNLDRIIAIVEQLQIDVADTFDEGYFRFLRYFFATIKFQAKYLHALESGDMGAEALRNSNQFNLGSLGDAAKNLNLSTPSVAALSDLAKQISECLTVEKFRSGLDQLALIRLPFLGGVETNPYARFGRERASESQPKGEPEPLLISVFFLTDNEPWANPQVLKPGVQYTITGLVKLNRLPESYDKLIIRHVSTTSDEFFTLSLPEINLTKSLEYSVHGQVVFKYPQNTFDPPVAVKLMAQLNSPTERSIYPHLIGYDELVSQIIDENKIEYPTGFHKMNKRAADIISEIKKELPHIERTELEDFALLLAAILNYSGYCAMYGIYKKEADLSEDEFRDRLIAYMSANPRLAQNLVKEGIIAGGRVEIRYINIIAELKVEKTVSDRKKMVENYSRQPAAYASATSAELSILCILDLTAKILPPAPAANNVTMIPAVFHGFENQKATSKVAVVIIDGNLKNPSSY